MDTRWPPSVSPTVLAFSSPVRCVLEVVDDNGSQVVRARAVTSQVGLVSVSQDTPAVNRVVPSDEAVSPM